MTCAIGMYYKLQTTVKYGYIVVGMSLGKRAKETQELQAITSGLMRNHYAAASHLK